MPNNYITVHEINATGKPSWLGHLVDIGGRKAVSEVDINTAALCGQLPSQGWGSLSCAVDQDGTGRVCGLCQANLKGRETLPEPLLIDVSHSVVRIAGLRAALELIRDCPAGPVWQIAHNALVDDDTATVKAEQAARASLAELQALGGRYAPPVVSGDEPTGAPE